MKTSRLLLASLIVTLLFVLLPAKAMAAMWDVPVAPGETFRWVFVTSGLTPATSSLISTYNDFVNDAVADAVVADPTVTTVTDVLGKSSITDIADIEWKAIASTSTVNAIDNIGASPAGIYTPLEDLVANGTADMFDGDIGSAIGVSEYGPVGQRPVWTGSWPNGTSFIFPLGGDMGMDLAAFGDNTRTNSGWINVNIVGTGTPQALYAISEELTVVPVPGALILAATGLLSSTLGLNRLRRKR